MSASPVTCKGVVIREVAYGESDKCLTVLTDEYGCIPVFCKGAKSYKSRFFVCAQLFCFSDLELYVRGENYWLKECSLIENFYGIREDIPGCALAQYFCDVVGDVTRENQKEPEILQLLLNCLHVIAKGKKDLSIVKGVFEMRLCSLAGFMPDLVGCEVCGVYEEESMCFDISGGELFCYAHRAHGSENTVKLSPTVAHALRYSVYCDPKRLFAFELGAEELREFSGIAERYILNHLERSFKTLEFYHTII